MIDPEGGFWAGAIFHGEHNHVLHEMHEVPQLVKLAPVFAMALGLGLSYYVYMMRPGLGARIAQMAGRSTPCSTTSGTSTSCTISCSCSRPKPSGWGLWRGGDVGIIDRFGPDGIAHGTLDAAKRVVRLQTGYVYHYAFVMLIGVAALVSWYLYLRLG